MSFSNDLQEEIKEGKQLTQLSPEALSYVTKPIGKAFFNHKGRPKKDDKAKWNDRIKCEICGVEFTRSNRTAHNKTKTHKIYSEMNQKLKKILLGN